jgi:5-bromo-4-chloroindolyl phosphate hydrolysis protein
MENRPSVFKIILAIIFFIGGLQGFSANIPENWLGGIGVMFLYFGIGILLLTGKNRWRNARRQRRYQQQFNQNQSDAPAGHAQESGNHTKNQADNYLQAIKSANDLILGDEISKDIDDVQKLTGEIFKYAQDARNKAALNRFFSYYLPTLLDLLKTYIELDKKSVQTQQIAQAKDKIAASIKSIKCAFTTLYDNLTSATTLNVESEIDALMNVMSLDGLHEGISLPEVHEEKISIK